MIQKLTQEQLVRAISDMGPHYAAILYGAGASKTSLIPLAREIVIDLCRESYGEASGLATNVREQIRANDIRQWMQMQGWFAEARERGESEYSAVFRQFKPTADHQIAYIRKLALQAKPSAAYDGLSHLVHAGYFDIALTTNFDPLLENRHKALFPVEVLNILKSDHDFRYANADTNRRQLAYLHGSLDGYSIANLDEHTRCLGTEAEQAMIRMLNGYALVVVGYSGTDSSVMELLQRLADGHASCFKRGVIYWCHLPGESLSYRAQKFLGTVAQGFTVEVYGFDHLVEALCEKLSVGADVFQIAKAGSELATSGKLLPDQAVLNLAPAMGLPGKLLKYRTSLKSTDDLGNFRSTTDYWQATVKDGYLWVLGDPSEMPGTLRDACSLTPSEISLAGAMNEEVWNIFAELANKALDFWLTGTLGLRLWDARRPKYFFPKLPDRDRRELRYRARRKRTQRQVVWLEFERGTESEKTRYFGHEAVCPRVILFQQEPVLRVRPTRLFTVEGNDVWTGRRAGTSIAKQVKSIWNDGYDALVRMWLDYFADGGERIRVPLTNDARKADFCMDFSARPYPARRVPA